MGEKDWQSIYICIVSMVQLKGNNQDKTGLGFGFPGFLGISSFIRHETSYHNVAMKLFKTLRNIISKYPLIGYCALMLLVVGSVLFNLRAYWNSPPPPLNAPLTITLALLAIVPSAWRQLFFITALIFVLATFVTLDLLNVTRVVNFSSIASIISVFSAAAYGGNRRNLASTASIVVYNGGMMYKLMFSDNIVFLSIATFFNVIGLFWNLITFLAIWWLGNTLRKGANMLHT